MSEADYRILALFLLGALFALWPAKGAKELSEKLPGGTGGILGGGLRLSRHMPCRERNVRRRMQTLRELTLKTDVDAELAAFEAMRWSGCLLAGLLSAGLYLLTKEVLFLAACIPLSALWWLKEEEGLKKKQKARERELQLEYAPLLSKLTLYMEAGLPLRRIWERIALEYSRKRRDEETPRRVVYDEILRTYYRMEGGLSEAAAYEEFGRRCRLSSYIMLGSLLSQSVRAGGSDLIRNLEEEKRTAFHQRLMLAKKQGEEASSKLLVPLGLMLMVVLAIVMIPAFLTFL